MFIQPELFPKQKEMSEPRFVLHEKSTGRYFLLFTNTDLERESFCFCLIKKSYNGPEDVLELNTITSNISPSRDFSILLATSLFNQANRFTEDVAIVTKNIFVVKHNGFVSIGWIDAKLLDVPKIFVVSDQEIENQEIVDLHSKLLKKLFERLCEPKPTREIEDLKRMLVDKISQRRAFSSVTDTEKFIQEEKIEEDIVSGERLLFDSSLEHFKQKFTNSKCQELIKANLR